MIRNRMAQLHSVNHLENNGLDTPNNIEQTKVVNPIENEYNEIKENSTHYKPYYNNDDDNEDFESKHKNTSVEEKTTIQPPPPTKYNILQNTERREDIDSNVQYIDFDDVEDVKEQTGQKQKGFLKGLFKK